MNLFIITIRRDYLRTEWPVQYLSTSLGNRDRRYLRYILRDMHSDQSNPAAGPVRDTAAVISDCGVILPSWIDRLSEQTEVQIAHRELSRRSV